MKIISINNKKVQICSSKVAISNMTSVHSTFFSILNLAVRKDFISNLTMIYVLGHEFSYEGFVTDKQEVDELYKYDLSLIIDVEVKRKLQRSFSILY